MALLPTTNEAEPATQVLSGATQPWFEAAPFAVIHLDVGGLVRAWNAAAERLFGWSPEEVLGHPLPTVPPDGESEYRARLGRALSGETLEELETVRLHKDGHRLDVRLSGAPVRDAAGIVTGAVLFIADIGSRMRAERSLQETESRYQALFDGNPFPMWVYDSETFSFLAVNDAAVEHYGYSRDEFLRMSIKDIRPPEEVGRLLDHVETLDNAPQDSASWNPAIWKHGKKDGTVFDVEVRATPLSFGGWPARLVVVKDVSAERGLEEQLRQSQKMDAIGQLAGGVAHDFNNILLVIGGHTELLLKRLDSEPLKQRAMSVLKAVDRAAALTRQLLVFSRKRLDEPTIVDLNAVMVEMERMLHRLIGEQIDLVAVPSPDLWRVKADPGQVEQVLMNLAVNARDAMPNGGRLVLETKNVEIDEGYTRTHIGLPCGEYVRLSVSDTGMGMDEETRSRIFEPFFTTKAKDKGTGLGLSIVYGIVKQSGGSVEVYSHLGRGTTFKVYLPRALAKADAAVPETETRPLPRGTETILLAEDEAHVRIVAREALEEQGYTVVEAADVADAISLARQHRPQLLVSDMVLRSTTGTELAAQVLAAVPEMRVLFMSGYTDRALESQGQIEAGTAFLQKPFTLEMLVRTVRHTLDELGATG